MAAVIKLTQLPDDILRKIGGLLPNAEDIQNFRGTSRIIVEAIARHDMRQYNACLKNIVFDIRDHRLPLSLFMKQGGNMNSMLFLPECMSAFTIFYALITCATASQLMEALDYGGDPLMICTFRSHKIQGFSLLLTRWMLQYSEYKSPENGKKLWGVLERLLKLQPDIRQYILQDALGVKIYASSMMQHRVPPEYLETLAYHGFNVFTDKDSKDPLEILRTLSIPEGLKTDYREIIEAFQNGHKRPKVL